MNQQRKIAPIVSIQKLNKIYPNGFHALKDIDLDIYPGEFLVIIGLSGSGKSTLLRCLNRLLDPTSGTLLFKGEDITQRRGRSLRQLRSNIGMIFQQFNLVPRHSVLDNTLMGCLSRVSSLNSILGLFPLHERETALQCLKHVGLLDRAKLRADELSGGQQQRVAIARTMVQNPDLLLADEPVASLDPATSHSVMDHLKHLNVANGITVVCNLHFLSLVRQYATRVIALKEGRLIFEGSPHSVDDAWFSRIYGEGSSEVEIR